jgi:hypothetical protein
VWLLTSLYSYVFPHSYFCNIYISAFVFLRTHACSLLSNSQCGCTGMSAWSAVRGRLGTRGCVIPAVGGQISCASLWVGARFFTFSLSLVAKVSRYYHQDTALRLLLGQLPPTCAGFSEPIYLISLHRACTQHALFYFCLCTQVIFCARYYSTQVIFLRSLFIYHTSIISRRARMYVLYMCAHIPHLQAPVPTAAHHLLAVGGKGHRRDPTFERRGVSTRCSPGKGRKLAGKIKNKKISPI